MKNICFVLLLFMFLHCFPAGAEEDSAEIAEWEKVLRQTVTNQQDTETFSNAFKSGAVISCQFGAFSADISGTDFSVLYIMNDSLVDFNDCYVGLNLNEKISETDSFNEGIIVPDMPETKKGIAWLYYNKNFPLGMETFRYETSLRIIYHTVYTLNNQKNITSILIEKKEASAEQWEELLKTAEELYYSSHKKTDLLSDNDVCLQGRAIIGKPVNDLIAVLGEPVDIQTLPDGSGRILVYSTIIASIYFDEKTGQEIVREITAFGPEYSGPRSVRVGNSQEEFRKAFSTAESTEEISTFSIENDTVLFSCCFSNNALQCWRLKLKEGDG